MEGNGVCALIAGLKVHNMTATINSRMQVLGRMCLCICCSVSALRENLHDLATAGYTLNVWGGVQQILHTLLLHEPTARLRPCHQLCGQHDLLAFASL